MHFCGACGWCFCGSVNYSRRAAIRKALDPFMVRLQLVKGGLDPLWALACLHKLAVLFDWVRIKFLDLVATCDVLFRIGAGDLVMQG